MKTLLRAVVALVVLAGPAYGQTITGNWQGVLQAGRDLRLVMTIASADGGGLRGVMYSIDQTPQGIPVTVTLQGSTVRMAMSGIGGAFEGTMTADGNTIAGTFTQGGKPLPLSLQRATPDTAWPIPQPPQAMAADARAVFDVATIKPSNPESPGRLFTVRGRQVITVNTTLNDLITFAYELHARQITGGPEWAEKEKYDITGQPEAPGTPSMVQLRAMVRQLLTDRFKLAFHRDKRELSVYAIVVGPNGHKLTKNETNPNGLPGLLFRGLGVLPGQQRDDRRPRRRDADRRAGPAGGGQDGPPRPLRLHAAVDARRVAVRVARRAGAAAVQRPQRAAGTLHRYPGTARSEARRHQGAGRGARHRPRREAVRELESRTSVAAGLQTRLRATARIGRRPEGKRPYEDLRLKAR